MIFEAESIKPRYSHHNIQKTRMVFEYRILNSNRVIYDLVIVEYFSAYQLRIELVEIHTFAGNPSHRCRGDMNLVC